MSWIDVAMYTVFGGQVAAALWVLGIVVADQVRERRKRK
jgi:hypothetical protein